MSPFLVFRRLICCPFLFFAHLFFLFFFTREAVFCSHERKDLLKLMFAFTAIFGAITAATAPSAPLVDLGVEAYAFLFPLVLVDTTRQNDPLVHKPNHLFNAPIFVPPLIHEVVRPNVDTLYTLAWLNLTAEPIVLSVPDTHAAYYVIQLMDLWSSTFAAPGKRTTGTTKQSFLICGPNNKLCPKQQHGATAGLTVLHSSTDDVWMIGRTQWYVPPAPASQSP